MWKVLINIKHGNYFFLNLFPAEFSKFDDFMWKKANVKQCGNFLRVVGK